MPKVSHEHEQARRDQILDAAARCFARSGFAATAMPDIAAAAQLAVGSMYRYYDSKEDLFLAVIRDRVAVYNDAVFHELSRPGPCLGRIGLALSRLQALLAEQPAEDARLSLELWARAHDVAPLRDWLRQARAGRVAAFRRVIEEGQQQGEVRCELEPGNAAAMLMAIADGLVAQRSCEPFLAAGGEALVELDRLLAGWQPNTEPQQGSRPR